VDAGAAVIVCLLRLHFTRVPAEAELEKVLVGPDSITWQLASDARLYFVMLYPLLLQVAHPTVGAGVRDYSDFERRPWQRLLRTLDYASLLVYGGGDAIPAGRRLRELHKRFRGVREDGKPYHALEPDAYAWVHATLLQAYLAGHERFGRRLTHPERQRFYREYRDLGRLIGVRDGDLPDDLAGFESYFERVVATELVRTEAVDRVLGAVRDAVHPPIRFPDPLWRAIRIPARRGLWLGGVGLLDPPLRARLGVRWTALDRAQFRSLGAACRRLEPIMPLRMRIMGPDLLCWRARAIARGPLG
jgi:uncharacterized protein (DUF2236 family)